MLSKEEGAIKSIQQLSFFASFSCKVAGISAGLSQHCFKVTATDNMTNKRSTYFVKSITSQHSIIANEVTSAHLAASFSLSPNVIFHCSDWLVTEFIEGNNLSDIDMTIDNKIEIAITQLQKLHSLSPSTKAKPISIAEIIDEQINSGDFLAVQKDTLSTLKETVINFEPSPIKVLCHGDANFSNFIIDQSQKCWLIDFECSFIGNAEFDIAMFIAINNLEHAHVNHDHLNSSYLSQAIKCYSTCSDYVLDVPLIHAYLACCYLINGIWYQSQSMTSKESGNFLALAHQQYQCFDQLHLSELKLVSVLP